MIHIRHESCRNHRNESRRYHIRITRHRNQTQKRHIASYIGALDGDTCSHCQHGDAGENGETGECAFSMLILNLY
jgi:hypothetical protein